MENTPRLYCELVAVMGQPRQWKDCRHLQTFIWMVVGLSCSGCANLTAWVPFGSSRARYAQSTQRRFARWLDNQRIEVHTLYAPLIQTALAEWGEHTLYLALDTSMLWKGQRPCKVEDFHLAPGRAMFLHHVAITGEHFGPVSLALARHTNTGEYWYVVSDEPTSVHTFVEYGWRFAIEENSLDDKSNGFQLESSLLRTADAVARLGLVLAVTMLYLVAQGTQVVAAQKRRWVDPHWFRGNSYLRIGWQWVKTALVRGWALFATLHLSGAPDPEPARASVSQSEQAPPVTFTVTYFYSPA